MGLLCLRTGRATIETFAGPELFRLLQNLVHGWLVKPVAVVKPWKRISSNRINDIYMAFLFQRTDPSVMHISCSPHSANLDPKGNFQLNLTRIILAMGKVLQLSLYLITGLTFPWVSRNQSRRRPFPPSFNLCSIGSTKSLATSKDKVSLGGVKGWKATGVHVAGQQKKLVGLSPAPFEIARAEAHPPHSPLLCVHPSTPAHTSACWPSLEPLPSG